MPFSNQFARIALSAAALTLGGCASASRAQTASEQPNSATQEAVKSSVIAPAGAPASSLATSDELRNSIVQLNSRIESLENRLAAMTDQLAAAKVAQTKAEAKAAELKTTPVGKHPVDSYDAPVAAGVAKSDPEAGFVNDDSVQTYRKAMVYYQAKRYSDAAMVFSTFVEKYPDHPLAGSAQYFVGDSYFKQGEYKLALVEFKKVLTSYDRSAQVAQTLRQMAEAEDALKKPEEAARHRQLLMSLFPQSPATVFQQSRNETGQPAPAGATPATPDSTTESAASGARANPEQGTPPPTAPIGNAEAPAGGTTTSEAAR